LPRPSRRADIRATAARFIREHGFSSATMDLIADEVGLNKGTLYHYYPSKSAILFELLSDQLDATLELIERVPVDGSPSERLRELVRLQVEHVATQQDEVVVFFHEMPRIDKNLAPDQVRDLLRRIDKYERFTRQLLSAGIASGEFRDFNISAVMYSVIGILAYLPAWFQSSSRKRQAQLVNELTEFVMRGITVGHE
jgi:TetR/AcrR family transcriptional regulator, cholesterol catabolism regulator